MIIRGSEPRLTAVGINGVRVPGIRVEHTDIEYTGRELPFDEEGEFESIQPVTGTKQYTEPLPMAHLLYQIRDDINLRAAFTRTLSRPKHENLVP